jgi:Mrp family chromosome partitioning ATPase/capsular polysaccharide biosynthesis protein
MNEVFPNRPASLADYLAVMRRRAWIIIIPLVLAPLATLLISSGEHAVYKSSASVYLDRTPATLAAVGIYDQSATQDPERFFQTQAVLARDPALLARVARRAHVSTGAFAGSSSVAPSSDSDTLVFSVESSNSRTAASLANAYASAFTSYKPQQDAQTLQKALTNVRKTMSSLRSKGVKTTADVYATLVNRESQLETALALQAGNAPKVVQPASGGSKIRPRTKRNALLGLALGAILGVGLAFLGEALDKRVRSEHDIEEILGLSLLARLPKPPRRLRRVDELPMLAEPRSIPAEAVRKLRTNVDFVNIEHKAQVMMITSSLEQEGKSTTIASLGVAFARAGRRVVLVDLDLRKPYLHRFFHIGHVPGMTDVVARRVDLQDALKPILIPGSDRTSARVAPYVNGNENPSSLLAVLPAGTMRADPGDFIGSESVAAVIDALRRDWDLVLIDAPPLPAVGDALELSGRVDAILAVTKFGVVHERMLHELARLLEASPAHKLGFVVTGAERGEVYDYGYGYVGAGPVPEPPAVLEQQRSRSPQRSRSAWSQRQVKRS